MKKSNTISKAKTQKQPQVGQKEVTKSVLIPLKGNLKNRLPVESKKDSKKKMLIKASKMNNPNHLYFDDDVLNEDLDLPLDIGGFADDVFDNENDFYKTEIDDF